MKPGEVCQTNYGLFETSVYATPVIVLTNPEKAAWIRFVRKCTWCWKKNTVTSIKVFDWTEIHNYLNPELDFSTITHLSYQVVPGPHSTYSYPETPWIINVSGPPAIWSKSCVVASDS